MSKNRDGSAIFSKCKVSLLLDTSSIVRVRNFSEAIPNYTDYFDIYTLEKNKTELSFLTEDPTKADFMMTCAMELIKQIQLQNIKTLKNGAPNVAMPKHFERNIDKCFPGNNLSYTDKLLLFFSSCAVDNVILITNDRELRETAEKMGITAFGAFELYLIVNFFNMLKNKQPDFLAPTTTTDFVPFIAQSKKIINEIPRSS